MHAHPTGGKALASIALLLATNAFVSIAFVLPTTAFATPCGDKLDGLRVACHCGDTVVSDTRLLASDPVVTAPCPLDGLTLHARPEAESLTLDLGGLTLEGVGVGVGIRVTYGGADGARIVGAAPGSRGVVRGFGIGVRSTTYEAIANISRLAVRDNSQEGLRLAIAGTILDDVVAAGNGGDGILLRGTGGRLIGVTSNDNAENGIRVFSHRTVVDAKATGNGRAGLIVDGFGNDVSTAAASGNSGHGIIVRGKALAPDGARIVDNGKGDLRVNGRSIKR